MEKIAAICWKYGISYGKLAQSLGPEDAERAYQEYGLYLREEQKARQLKEAAYKAEKKRKRKQKETLPT